MTKAQLITLFILQLHFLLMSYVFYVIIIYDVYYHYCSLRSTDLSSHSASSDLGIAIETSVLIGAPAVSETEIETGPGWGGEDLRLRHRDTNPQVMSLQLKRGKRSLTRSWPAPEERTSPRPNCAWCYPKSPTRAGLRGIWHVDVNANEMDYFLFQLTWHWPQSNVACWLKWIWCPWAKMLLASTGTLPSWILWPAVSNFHLSLISFFSRARICIKILKRWSCLSF